MGAQQLEELVVYVACVALGVWLLAVPYDRLPPVLQPLSKGNRRKGFGVAAIVLGLVMLALMLAGVT
jgi:hypothetical protein